MATISVPYPAEYTAEIMAGLRETLPEEDSVLTDAEVAKKAVRRYLLSVARGPVRREVLTTDMVVAELAVAASQKTLAAAQQTRKNAEVAADAALDAAFEGV